MAFYHTAPQPPPGYVFVPAMAPPGVPAPPAHPQPYALPHSGHGGTMWSYALPPAPLVAAGHAPVPPQPVQPAAPSFLVPPQPQPYQQLQQPQQPPPPLHPHYQAQQPQGQHTLGSAHMPPPSSSSSRPSSRPFSSQPLQPLRGQRQRPRPGAPISGDHDGPRDNNRQSATTPPKPVAWSEKATADAIASDTRGWEVEPGVVNVRLLLLKSRDMRRKLRAAMHHATRPRQLLNHNEAAKVQRRDHFAARLTAMEAAARTCGMLPATNELTVEQAAIFRAQSNVPAASSDAAAPECGQQNLYDEAEETVDGTALWSSPDIMPFLCLRVDLRPPSPTTALGRSTSSAGNASSVESAVPPPMAATAETNYAAALALFQDGRMALATTRTAIHAALYRKFVLSFAFHAARVAEFSAEPSAGDVETLDQPEC